MVVLVVVVLVVVLVVVVDVDGIEAGVDEDVLDELLAGDCTSARGATWTSALSPMPHAAATKASATRHTRGRGRPNISVHRSGAPTTGGPTAAPQQPRR